MHGKRAHHRYSPIICPILASSCRRARTSLCPPDARRTARSTFNKLGWAESRFYVQGATLDAVANRRGAARYRGAVSEAALAMCALGRNGLLSQHVPNVSVGSHEYRGLHTRLQTGFPQTPSTTGLLDPTAVGNWTSVTAGRSMRQALRLMPWHAKAKRDRRAPYLARVQLISVLVT